MEYTFVTVGECSVEEELTDHSIPSLYNLPVNSNMFHYSTQSWPFTFSPLLSL